MVNSNCAIALEMILYLFSMRAICFLGKDPVARLGESRVFEEGILCFVTPNDVV